MSLKVFCSVLAVLVWAAAVCSSAELRDENLVLNIPSGYKVDYQVRQGNMLLTEMVTINTHFGLRNISPESCKAKIQQWWDASCKGSQFAPVTNGEGKRLFLCALAFGLPSQPVHRKNPNIHGSRPFRATTVSMSFKKLLNSIPLKSKSPNGRRSFVPSKSVIRV